MYFFKTLEYHKYLNYLEWSPWQCSAGRRTARDAPSRYPWCPRWPGSPVSRVTSCCVTRDLCHATASWREARARGLEPGDNPHTQPRGHAQTPWVLARRQWGQWGCTNVSSGGSWQCGDLVTSAYHDQLSNAGIKSRKMARLNCWLTRIGLTLTFTMSSVIGPDLSRSLCDWSVGTIELCDWSPAPPCDASPWCRWSSPSWAPSPPAPGVSLTWSQLLTTFEKYKL